MFDDLLKIVRVNISTVRKVIQTNDRLRVFLFRGEIITQEELDKNAEISKLIKDAPNEREWQIYDHCAVVTRLYAIYERFVEDLITEWLEILPIIVTNYSDLEERIVEIVCQALTELVTYQVIMLKSSKGQAKEIGKITEWFKQPQAAVAKIKDINLFVGMDIFLVSETAAYCQSAKVKSIKINDIYKEQIMINNEQEIGLKFDVDAKKGLSIYFLENNPFNYQELQLE